MPGTQPIGPPAKSYDLLRNAGVAHESRVVEERQREKDIDREKDRQTERYTDIESDRERDRDFTSAPQSMRLSAMLV